REICRACLGTSPVMFNIFDNVPGKEISIADLITRCTQYDVSKGDSYPENICDTCLHLAQNCWEVQQAIQKSNHRFLQLNKEKEKAQTTTKCASGPLTCSHCSKSFRFKSQLEGHLLTQKVTLQKHIRTHTGERPYKCSHCSKAFSRKGALKTHIGAHKCSHCFRTYAHSSHLWIHMKIHTGELPYNCSQCPQSFSQQNSLKNHIQMHTGDRPLECSHCTCTFTRKNTLRKHSECN
ncbi:hypothetical protein KR054_004417, partial [Drosophila jambulina]